MANDFNAGSFLDNLSTDANVQMEDDGSILDHLEPDESPDAIKSTSLRGLASGVLDVGQSAGGVMQYAGSKLMTNTPLTKAGAVVESVGESVSDFFKATQKKYAPTPKGLDQDILTKEGTINTDLLTNPDFYRYNIPKTGMSMLPSIIATLATKKPAGKLADMLKASPKLARKIVDTIPYIAGGTVGGLQEGVGQREEMLEKGASPLEANLGFEAMTAGSAALNALSFAKMFNKLMPKQLNDYIKFAKHIVDGTITETGTEWLEDPLSIAINLGLLSPDGRYTREDAIEALRKSVNIIPIAATTGFIGSTGGAAIAKREEIIAKRRQKDIEDFINKVKEIYDTKEPDNKSLEEVVLPPSEVVGKRQSRDVKSDIKKLEEEKIQNDLSQLTDMLDTRGDEELIKPDEISTTAIKDETRRVIENKVKELGSIEKVREFYNNADAVSTLAREYAEAIFKVVPENIKKPESPKALTEEEVNLAMSDEYEVDKETISEIRRMPADAQRRWYDNLIGNQVSIAHSKQDIDAAAKAGEAVRAAIMTKEQAKPERRGRKTANPNALELTEMQQLDLDITAFKEQVKGRDVSDWTAEEEATNLALIERMTALDPIEDAADSTYISDLVDWANKKTAIRQKEEQTLKDYAQKKLKEKGQDNKGKKKVTAEQQAEWDKLLSDEGMPADLDVLFDDDTLNQMTSKEREEADILEKHIKTNAKNSLEAKEAFKIIANAVLNRTFGFKDENAVRAALVKAYKWMPTNKEEALEWHDLISRFEEVYGRIIPSTRKAFSRKSIAQAVANGKITPEQAKYANTILNTLSVQPSFELQIGEWADNESNGLYDLVNNLISVKDHQALAHEIGHFAFFNVLTSADRQAFREDFINRYFGADGNLDFNKLIAETTDPVNTVINPAEIFAVKFSDYTIDKVLSNTEKTLFQKVISWFQNMKRLLAQRGLKIEAGERLEKLFDKVVNKNVRTFWTESGAISIERTPTSMRDFFYSKDVYHGGHTFYKKFLNAFIGSGVGQWMRGYGTYLTDSKEVASQWAKLVANDKLHTDPNAKPVLYTASIPDDIYLLNMDEDIPMQDSKLIRERFQEIQNRTGYSNELKRTLLELIGDIDPVFGSNITGEELYNRLYVGHKNSGLSPKDAAKATSKFLLDEVGYFGNIYQMDGDNYYVIFPENVATITKAESINYSLLDEAQKKAKMLLDIATKAKEIQTSSIVDKIKGKRSPEEEALLDSVIFVTDKSTLWDRFKRTVGPWIVSPMKFVEGTILERHVYNTNLSEMYIGFMYDRHRTEIDGILLSLKRDGGDPKNVRKVIEGQIEGTQSEKIAAEHVRAWLDNMKARYKAFMLNQYKKGLSKTEYNALLDIIVGTSTEQVAAKYPRLATKTIEGIAKKFKEIDTWGIDNYIPNVESGRFKIVESIPDESGKVHQKLVAIAFTEDDAIRKAVAYYDNNPGTFALSIDTDYKVIEDDRTRVSARQAAIIQSKLAKQLAQSIENIDKGVSKAMAAKAVKGRFKITPTHTYSPFLEKRKDILQGEEDIFPVLRSYAYSIEKKMALDPVIDDIKRDLKNMDKYQKEYILDYLEDVKGKYSKADKFVDNIFRTYRGYSRAVARVRTVEANIKLGYRPVAAMINLASGQMHAWVKRGAVDYIAAIKYIRTEDGKKFAEDIEAFLGTTIIDSGTDIQSKTPLWQPLGLFQVPEPMNRITSATAAYLYAKRSQEEGGLGLNDIDAKSFAIRANWTEQFTYNMANLPKIMRGSTGKLITQFKPYLTKEVEFMSTLSGREWVRYLGMQLMLGGPRGLLMVMRSLPILSLFGFWDDACDWLEEWMNKKAPLASRGIGGLPGLIDSSYAIDVSAAATFQFPSDPSDFAGPFLSDLMTLKTKVLDPVSSLGPYAEDLKKTGDIVPIIRHWRRLMQYAFSDDDWLRNDKGEKMYEVPSAIPFIIQSLAGTENVDLARIRAEDRILAKRDIRSGHVTTRLLNSAMTHILAGESLPNDLIMQMRKQHISADTLIRRIETAQLTPRQRAILKSEIRNRFNVIENYPVESDYMLSPEPVLESPGEIYDY